MRFAPQRRAIFGHLNFQKCAKTVSFWAFWLAKMLRATVACNFWTSELPKARQDRQFFSIFTCKCASRRHSGMPFLNIATAKSAPKARCFVHFYLKCASRHSGVQFFLSVLSSYLRTRRFSELTFRPSRHTNHWKNTGIRDFPNISRGWIFFLLTFAQLYLLSSDSTSLLSAFHLCSAFQLSILSDF